MEIKLPLNIAVPDLLMLIQGSLDQIGPVILLSGPEIISHLNLSKLKSHHFHLMKNEYIYLNYSIRNSLSRFDSSLTSAKSFDEIYDYLERNLQK